MPGAVPTDWRREWSSGRIQSRRLQGTVEAGCQQPWSCASPGELHRPASKAGKPIPAGHGVAFWGIIMEDYTDSGDGVRRPVGARPLDRPHIYLQLRLRLESLIWNIDSGVNAAINSPSARGRQAVPWSANAAAP